MARDRRISSRSPRGLVRCSAVWMISAERRMVLFGVSVLLDGG
jgi:hypothetical protein